jgi:DNA-binding transcriptional regulator YiaG
MEHGETARRELTGAGVRELRFSVGLTQAELAELLHIAVSTIARWESRPTMKLRRIYAEHVLRAVEEFRRTT